MLPSTFVDLTSVVFTGLREGNVSGGVALDNIEYQLAAPEVLAACVAIPLASDTPTVSIASPLAGNVAGTVVVEATASRQSRRGERPVQVGRRGSRRGRCDRPLHRVVGYHHGGGWPAYDYRGSPRCGQQRRPPPRWS